MKNKVIGSFFIGLGLVLIVSLLGGILYKFTDDKEKCPNTTMKYSGTTRLPQLGDIFIVERIDYKDSVWHSRKLDPKRYVIFELDTNVIMIDTGSRYLLQKN